MADKGFNIENECLLYNLSLHMETYQMVPSNLIKTKKLVAHAYKLNQLFNKLKLFKYFPMKFLLI